MNVHVQGPLLGQTSKCEPILRSLPEWFGIEEAIVHYLQEIENLPTFIAEKNDEILGFLSLKMHTDFAAEIYVMGIRPEAHHQGIGRKLLQGAENNMREQGIEFLQVKTLSPARPDPNYSKTRLFYEALGFRPLEEFKELWGKENPCLQMIKKL